MAKLRDSAELVECLPSLQVRPHFGIGDIVWAQARGLPSWPGKIVDETIVGKGRPDDGKVQGTCFHSLVKTERKVCENSREGETSTVSRVFTDLF